MRPPRSTLQPIGQQLAERAGIEPVAVPTVPAIDPLVVARVRTQPLPGVLVLPAPPVTRVRTRPAGVIVLRAPNAGGLS